MEGWALGKQETTGMMCWCGHGHAASIPEDSDHPVSIFMDDIYKKCKGDITVEMFFG